MRWRRATAETNCDGAVAAALVLGGWQSSWAGARLVFAEELEKIYRFVVIRPFLLYLLVARIIRLVLFSNSACFYYASLNSACLIFDIWLFSHIGYSATYSAFFLFHLNV
jgi:hypothetical protein